MSNFENLSREIIQSRICLKHIEEIKTNIHRVADPFMQLAAMGYVKTPHLEDVDHQVVQFDAIAQLARAVLENAEGSRRAAAEMLLQLETMRRLGQTKFELPNGDDLSDLIATKIYEGSLRTQELQKLHSMMQERAETFDKMFRS